MLANVRNLRGVGLEVLFRHHCEAADSASRDYKRIGNRSTGETLLLTDNALKVRNSEDPSYEL